MMDRPLSSSGPRPASGWDTAIPSSVRMLRTSKSRIWAGQTMESRASEGVSAAALHADRGGHVRPPKSSNDSSLHTVTALGQLGCRATRGLESWHSFISDPPCQTSEAARVTAPNPHGTLQPPWTS